MAEDLRIIKNKRNMEAALIGLMKEKPFSKITIQDICKSALVSRSTFYAHYLDKYDLLENIVDRYVALLQELVASRFSAAGAMDMATVFSLLAQTYRQHREPFSVLLHVRVPECDFREKIEQLLFSHCLAFLETQPQQYVMPDALIAKLYVSNVMTLMTWTLEHGLDEAAVRNLQQLQAVFLREKL